MYTDLSNPTNRLRHFWRPNTPDFVTFTPAFRGLVTSNVPISSRMLRAPLDQVPFPYPRPSPQPPSSDGPRRARPVVSAIVPGSLDPHSPRASWLPPQSFSFPCRPTLRGSGIRDACTGVEVPSDCRSLHLHDGTMATPEHSHALIRASVVMMGRVVLFPEFESREVEPVSVLQQFRRA